MDAKNTKKIQENNLKKQKKFLFCLIGPSASGKTTLIRDSKQELNFGEVISTTTRAPRNGEVEGKDYYFVSKSEFLGSDMLEKDEYAGDLYGTSLKSLIKALDNKNGAMTAITYEGYISIKKAIKENNALTDDIKVISCFINTPIEKLEARMRARGDSEENIKKRLQNIIKRDEYSNKDKVDVVFTPLDDNSKKTNENFINKIKFVCSLNDINYNFKAAEKKKNIVFNRDEIEL